MMLLLSRWLGTKPRTLAGARRDSGNEGCGHPQDVDHCAECGSSNHHSGRMRATSECAQNLGSRDAHTSQAQYRAQGRTGLHRCHYWHRGGGPGAGRQLDRHRTPVDRRASSTRPAGGRAHRGCGQRPCGTWALPDTGAGRPQRGHPGLVRRPVSRPSDHPGAADRLLQPGSAARLAVGAGRHDGDRAQCAGGDPPGLWRKRAGRGQRQRCMDGASSTSARNC
jgi:hypothetical protein